MVEQLAITGTIKAYTGAAVGASSIRMYTIDANVPGVGVVTLNNQRPLKAYPDTVDTIAYEPGDGVHGIVIGPIGAMQVQWQFLELIAFGSCDDPTGATGPGGTPITPPPINPIGIASSGGTSDASTGVPS